MGEGGEAIVVVEGELDSPAWGAAYSGRLTLGAFSAPEAGSTTVHLWLRLEWQDWTCIASVDVNGRALKECVADLRALHRGEAQAASLWDSDSQEILWLRPLPAQQEYVTASGALYLFLNSDVQEETPLEPFSGGHGLAYGSSVALAFRGLRVKRTELPRIADRIEDFIHRSGMRTDYP